MAGNPANAAVWGGADVLIAPIGTAIPVANAAFGVGWEPVGLLDGGQGFEESIETSSTDHTAWGYGVIATTYGDTKVTKTFSALEENEAVLSLVYDTSGLTIDDVAGTYSGDLAVRDNTTRVLVAFVTKSGGIERRQISKNYATIVATSAGSEGEESLGTKGFEVTIVPDANKVLYYTYKGASL
jgi:hypothetical protein